MTRIAATKPDWASGRRDGCAGLLASERNCPSDGRKGAGPTRNPSIEMALKRRVMGGLMILESLQNCGMLASERYGRAPIYYGKRLRGRRGRYS